MCLYKVAVVRFILTQIVSGACLIAKKAQPHYTRFMPITPLFNLFGDKLHALPLLVLYLTDGCNSRCITCDIWRNPRRNMPLALVESLAAAAGELGLRWVLLSGGEAMQHPEWPQIARRFRVQRVHTMLLTNGLLLRRQMDEVQQSVDELIVSLDAGQAETYAHIRGVDAFDLVLDGIRAARERGIPVTTRTTVQRDNYRELPQIIEAALAADVNSISFLAVDTSNPFAFGDRFPDGLTPPEHGPPATALAPSDLDELAALLDEIELRYAAAFQSGRMAETPAKLRRILLQYFTALNNRGPFPRPRCNAPHFSTVVEVDGTLRPCYFLPAYGRLVPEGPPLAQMLNSDPALALRQAYRSGRRPECERCVCPLYKGPRALLGM